MNAYTKAHARLTLLLYDYELVGISLGVLAVVEALIIRVLTVDPISGKAYASSKRIK